MANLFITIVSTKKMLNGKHKVRIAVSHNLTTRYIPTNIIIDAENEFKNGKVVKRPDKDILNARLKKIYDMYYERCIIYSLYCVVECALLSVEGCIRHRLKTVPLFSALI